MEDKNVNGIERMGAQTDPNLHQLDIDEYRSSTETRC